MSAHAADSALIPSHSFALTEDQEQLCKEIREFAAREIAPNVMRWDEASEFPLEVVQKLGAMGLMGVIFPVELGGAGLGYVDYALAVEELSAVDGSIGIIVASHNSLCTNHIFVAGNEEQKRKYIPLLASGKWLGAWGLTEPGSGSDAGSARTTAVRKGDRWVLNGNKTFITNGPYADTIVFYAKLDDGSDTPLRQRPVLTFILDSGMPGLEQSKPFRKMGLHSSPTGELFLTDVRVTKDRLLGETEGQPGGREGRESAKGNFVTERAGVAAMSLGLIEECLKLSVQYAKDRMLWERPISEFQLIQLKLARMEVARLNVENLVFRHIEMSAAGKSLTLAEASAMKLYSAQAASEVAMEAVQLLGGNGYMAEFRVEQLARDAKVFQIYAGTDEIQVTHIARDLLAR